MKMCTTIFVAALVCCGCQTITGAQTDADCSQNDIQQCESSASALFEDPSLVYPDNTATLDRACRTWSDFTNCIYKYTNRCLSPAEKSRFNQSFKEPVLAMNTLCQDKNYRKEYLTYAPCIKRIATEQTNCGLQYRFLIDLFSGNTATMKQLCCARAKFRNCILLKTRDQCTAEKNGGDEVGSPKSEVELNVTVFATQILDKSLAFIAQQCSHTSVREEDCPGITASTAALSGSSVPRPNSKGPLQNPQKNSELQPSASSEKKRQANSTDFKLGKPSPTSASNFQLPKSSSTSANANKIPPNTAASQSQSKSNPEPQQDQLSAGNNGDDKDGASTIIPLSILMFIGIASANIIYNVHFC